MTGGDLYQAIGGTAGCRRLAELFYAKVQHDPVLRPFFPGKSMRCAIEAFSAYLVQFLGGPADDAAKRWWISLRESHQRFAIGRTERTAWMKLMVSALDDAAVTEPARAALLAMFERSSAYVVNQSRMPAPDGMPPEIARLWRTQRTIDEAVAAIRRGDAQDAVARVAALDCDYSRLSGILGLMIASGNDAMVVWVNEKLHETPALVEARYNARTLLHAAAAAGNLRIVQTLLRLGADPNATDGGRHTPLYTLGNECGKGGAEVARALVAAGADVNACAGAKRCTPLHMAARRGNVDLARALLALGADRNAADTQGDTPLDRAVNCRKPEVAALLR
jgi:hemoglobin